MRRVIQKHGWALLAIVATVLVFWGVVRTQPRGEQQMMMQQQERERQERNKKEQNRKMERARAARYNVFLIGNALSIIFGVLGALIIKYWPK